MPLFLAARLHGVQELMENPACEPRRLHNTYVQFRKINAAVSGLRRLYRRYLLPQARTHRGPITLLDIGFGGGDIPIALARWGQRDGLDLQITAIDTDTRAVTYARARPHPPNVTFRQASTDELLARGERFDWVLSNHLLHHLAEDELHRMCDDSRRLCRSLVIHSDIVRSDLAYLAFAGFTVPFFHRSFIVADGLTSIRRSFTRRELRGLAPPGWTVAPAFPFHQLLLHATG